MRFSFPILLSLGLGACLIASLRAQEVKQPQPAVMGVINDVDVTVTNLTAEKLNNPPKREIRVERLKEPLKLQLTKPDAKLFEQKFAARLDLEIPDRGDYHSQVTYQFMAGDVNVAQLGLLDERHLIAPNHRSDANTASESFARMIKALPADDAPAKAERDFFSNPENRDVMLSFFHQNKAQNPSRKNVWSFTILGTTPEQLELRSQALLTILDQGACRPIQLAMFKRREPTCVQVRDQRRAAESAQRITNVLQDELKSYIDFTPDMLPNLRVQQLQLDVDLAGVKARIAACDRLLAGTALKPERRSQVEDLKVAAEIEFSGFEARLTKSNEIIGKVKTKIDLLSKLTTAQKTVQRVGGTVQQLEDQIKAIDAAIHAYAPLPLVDNKITVQPIEWTQ